jgi:hypothetical protein
MTTTLFTSPNLEIHYDEEAKILICRWIGFQTTEQVKDGGLKVLALVQEHKITKIMNDNREVVGSWEEAAYWVATELFPELIQAGLKHFAWLLSANVYSEMSARFAMEGVAVVRPFYFHQEAREWLNAQPE